MFETIADARKGTVAVNRIYKGNTLVWSRYNWEKWSCQTNYESGLGVELGVEGSLGLTESAEGSTFCRSRTEHYGWGSDKYFEFSGERDGAGYTYEELYNAGYRYGASAGERVYVGDYYVAMSYIASDSLGRRHIVIHSYKVIQKSTFSGYSKGSTNYGIVTGNQGDYPSNGRHSDGYWYVSVGAMGFEEEEGNP